MAYIGTQPVRGQYRKLSDISSGFNGSTTTFTTSVPPGTSSYYVTAGSASQLLVSLGGVIQQPDVDYTVGIYSITFTTAPAAGLSFFGVLMGDSLNSGSPADGSVTTSKLAGNLSLGLAGGSASTPSLFFTGDANTGVYSPGADTLAFVEGGTEAMRIDSSGRLGLGTSSPQKTLHVLNPGSTYQAELRLGGTSTYYFDLTHDATTTGKTIYNAYALTGTSHGHQFQVSGTNALLIDASGRVGIGTTTPGNFNSVANQLVVGSGSSDAGITLSTGTSSSGYLAFCDTGNTVNQGWYGYSHTDNALLLGANGSERARIDSSGRLLVGTSTVPTVAGILPDATVYKSSGDSVTATVSNSLSNGNIAGFIGSASGRNGTIAVIKHSGITNACAYLNLQQEDANNAFFWSDNSANLRCSSSPSNIGTTGGTVVGTQTSDERIKNILGPVEYGLDTLKQIEPVRFSLKSEPETEKLGFIAQQVQPLVPQSVFDTKEHIEGEPEDAPTKLGMEYVALIPVLVNAIKELSAEIDALKTQLS